MGFSLIFVATDGEEQRDADRSALAAFLAERGLHVEGEESSSPLFDATGAPLSFDGRVSDLHLDPLDQEGPLTGGIWHASLSDAECAFIHDLCAAAGFLIANPQGDPMYVVPVGTHTPEQVPDLDDTAWVAGWAELQRALSDKFDDFRAYRDSVIGLGAAEHKAER